MITSYTNESILARAVEKKILKISTHNIRDYTTNKHKKIDDKPYGGGAGMVMMFQPIADAVKKLKKKNKKTRVILFSTRGKLFSHKEAKRLTKYDQIILICGRYEGVDERVAKYVADEEISVGNYILTGGELPALILTDAVSRKIPGVLGKQASLEENQGSYPTYTRPVEVIWNNPKTKKKQLLKVPKQLTQGKHKEIKLWRSKFDKQS